MALATVVAAHGATSTARPRAGSRSRSSPVRSPRRRCRAPRALAPVLARSTWPDARSRPGEEALAPFALGAFAAGTAAAIALPFYPGLPRLDASGIQLGWPDGGAHHLEVPDLRRRIEPRRPPPRDAASCGRTTPVLRRARARGGSCSGAISWARDRPGAAAPAGLRAAAASSSSVGAYVVPYLLILAPKPARVTSASSSRCCLSSRWPRAGSPRRCSTRRVRGPGAPRSSPAAFLAGPRVPRAALRAGRARPPRPARSARGVGPGASSTRTASSSPSPGTGAPAPPGPRESVRIDLEDAGIYTLPWLALPGHADGPSRIRRGAWRVQIFPLGARDGPRASWPRRTRNPSRGLSRLRRPTTS
jgi:hypothetical protein